MEIAHLYVNSVPLCKTFHHIFWIQSPIFYQKPRTKLSVLLLLLLNCHQIFASPSKSLQASQNICMCLSQVQKTLWGWVAIVVVVCGKLCGKICGEMCGKMCGKIKKMLDCNTNLCASRYGPHDYDSGDKKTKRQKCKKTNN